MTTKKGSSSQRITVLLARNLVVWVFFIFVPINHDEKGEAIYSEYFSWLQLSGFVILALGIFIMNEILVIPFLGFDKNLGRDE